MSYYFQIDNLRFYPQKNEIQRGKEVLKVRPKTSDLLIVLLEANGEIVSKSELLAKVWNDVVVEEHVIFQSITELRKILGDSRIIKTHPRKGYSIATTVKKCTEQRQVDTAHQQDVKPPSNHLKRVLLAYRKTFAIAVIVLIIAFIAELSLKTEAPSSLEGTVIVLPVSNRIESSEHAWLRYGGMDLLVKQLQSQSVNPVLPTELVLDTLKRASVDGEVVDENTIARIFEISGAEIIISLAISGFSGDYQLVYSIYERDDVTRGVLFAEQTNALFAELSALLLRSMGVIEKKEIHDYQHNFANELMASAIDEMQLENYSKAVTMFKAVLVNEPENLLASRMLAKSHAHLGEFKQMEIVATDAVEYAMKAGDNKNLGRLFLWQAISLTQQAKYNDALSILKYAKAKAEHNDDLLYLANASRIAGKIYLQQSKYSEARSEISQALTIYSSIGEPYGQSSMYIDLGELELAHNNTDEAKVAFEKALEIAKKSNLEQLIKVSEEWLTKTI